MSPPKSAARVSPPSDLTIPEPGSKTAHHVLSRAIARLLPEVAAIGRAAPLSAACRADVALFQALLRDLSAKSPGALPSLARRVHIGTLVRCLRAGASEPLVRELLGLVFFELARAGALPANIRQKAPPTRLVSPAARLALGLPPETSTIVYENEKIVVEGSAPVVIDLEALADVAPGFSENRSGVSISRPYFPIAGEMLLALADNNPLSMFEAHPDKEGNAIDLGGKDAPAWTGVLRSSLDLVDAHLPDLRREMDLFVQQIVPVGYHDQRHLSASYQEAIGTIYMTLHPSLMTMTEALIHEFSHNKINALFELDDLLENAFSPLYTSPVRPDPRPLHGVLLAVHAFLPVARLYEKMIESGHPLAKNPGFEERFRKVRQINAEGAEVVLGNGKPTEVGKAVLEEIRRWDEYFVRFG